LNQQNYRGLHDALLAYEGNSAYVDVLLPWLKQHPNARTWLYSFEQREGHPIPPVEEEELWELYALSRVCELLLIRFQDAGTDASDWPGPDISADEFVAFIEALGLTVVKPMAFSAFYHEVVTVLPSNRASHTPEILAYKWPCVMLGNMMFLRGGVVASAASAILDPSLAASSTLYWAYRRRARPYQDLSHGWGSNSQWRTAFRRDYVIGNVQFFNVDGERDLGSREQQFATVEESDVELTLDERIELLTNRCFVISTKPHGDLWPYDDFLKLTTN
jgi:hypothetical protein